MIYSIFHTSSHVSNLWKRKIASNFALTSHSTQLSLNSFLLYCHVLHCIYIGRYSFLSASPPYLNRYISLQSVMYIIPNTKNARVLHARGAITLPSPRRLSLQTYHGYIDLSNNTFGELGFKRNISLWGTSEVKTQFWLKTKMWSRVERTTIVESEGVEFGKFNNAHWYLPTSMTASVGT